MFSNWLKDQLNKFGLSQKELARRLGMHSAQISRFYTGDRVPTPEQCLKIADGLGIYEDEALFAAGYKRSISPNNAMDPDEFKLLTIYRKMTNASKTTLLSNATALVENEDEVIIRYQRLRPDQREKISKEIRKYETNGLN